MKKALRLSNSWKNDSWKNFPINQPPKWPKKKIKQNYSSY